MPTYVYVCPQCDKEIETMHSMSEEPKLECEDCKIALKRKFIPSKAIIVGDSFREGRTRQPREVGRKLEEYKAHPEKDPYKAHRDK